MSWNEKKIEILKENWGKLTASAIAEKIGNISRNAVIGKAYRLNLSSKIKGRNVSNSSDTKKNNNEFQFPAKKRRRNKSVSIISQTIISFVSSPRVLSPPPWVRILMNYSSQDFAICVTITAHFPPKTAITDHFPPEAAQNGTFTSLE